MLLLNRETALLAAFGAICALVAVPVLVELLSSIRVTVAAYRRHRELSGCGGG